MSSQSRPALRLLRAVLIDVVAVVLLILLFLKQPVFARVKNAASEKASPARLQSDVTALTSIEFRDSDHPPSLDRAAGYIQGQFLAAGGKTHEQPFQAQGQTYRNVIATFGPDTSPVILVGAHYDVFSMGENFPGADDNTSGTAGLLELSRLLGKSKLKHRVDIISYSTEEPPFFASDEMGSAVHARSVGPISKDIRGMICLEMIGYFTKVQPWPNAVFSSIYPSSGDFIAVVGRPADIGWLRIVKKGMRRAGTIPVVSFTGPRILGMDASDHRNYWDAGIPAVMVTDTAYIRNPNYHTAADRPETLDYQRMAGVIDAVANAIVEADQRP